MNRRIKLLGFGLSVLATLGACTVLEPSGYSPHNDLYFIDHMLPVIVDRAYLDRYACRSGTPIACECGSLRLGTCRCSC